MDISLLTNSAQKVTDMAMNYSPSQLMFLVGNSLLIGIILFLFNYRAAYSALNRDKSNFKLNKTRAMLGAANILYLCLGLTVVMILVNNNLARAFAIGATVALVRFRVKLEDRSAASNILFGIIAGMACGLNEIFLAWIVAGLYILISSSLNFVANLQRKSAEKDGEPKENKQDQIMKDIRNKHGLVKAGVMPLKTPEQNARIYQDTHIQ